MTSWIDSDTYRDLRSLAMTARTLIALSLALPGALAAQNVAVYLRSAALIAAQVSGM